MAVYVTTAVLDCWQLAIDTDNRPTTNPKNNLRLIRLSRLIQFCTRPAIETTLFARSSLYKVDA